MRRVNWTIVAISAGITLGASVAVLGTGPAVPESSGLVVPRSMPVDEQPVAGTATVTGLPPVVSITAAGYTQQETPPPPPPPPPPVKPKAAVKTKAKPKPVSQVVRKTTNTAQQVVDQGIDTASDWTGWFTDASQSFYDSGRHWSDTRGPDGGGRHRADSSYGGGWYGGGWYGGGSYGGGGCHHW